MYWRVTRAAFESQKGAANKRAFKRVVGDGPPPGLIAYDGDKPIGWIALAPREDYPRLSRSRVLKPVDDRDVWSISCFFVAKGYRRSGISVRLLNAAVDHARTCGVRCVEGYPIEPRQGDSPDPFVYTGLASAFLRVGFREVTRRSPTRPIMRRTLRPSRC